MICVMKTNEKYIAPESEEIMVMVETRILEGSTQGDEGCPNDCEVDYD